MKSIYYTITFLILILSSNSNAKVWEDDRRWDERDITSFKQWITTNVNREIFSNHNSPYYNIQTDCADAIYALMAIYSYENNLYFQIKIDKNRYIDNRLNFLDKYEGVERVKEFIHYIGKMTGTYSLARYNSYPVKISSLTTGDIFLAKWKTEEGKYNHHAYLIKSVTETGYFKLYSSSTPVRVRVLNYRKGMPKYMFEKSPWGFKRPAPYYLVSKERESYSLEQYKLRDENPAEFFNKVRDILAKKEETLSSYYDMRFSNLCQQFKQRIDTVEGAITYFDDKNNQCADSNEFYLYSTPSLDNSIGKSLYKLLTEWSRLSDKQKRKVKRDLRHTLNYISAIKTTYRTKEKSFDACPLYVEGKKYYIRYFLEKLKKGEISSHPNDNINARWGGKSQRTDCPIYKQDITIF